MRIRKYLGSDALSASTCIKRSLEKISSKYYPREVITNLKECYNAKNLKAGPKEPHRMVADEGGKVVGTVALTLDGWIFGLFVDPGYFGRNIGGRLLEKIEAVAKKDGFSKVRSHAAINAVDFYKKHGYKVVKPVEFAEYGKTYMVIKKLK